MSQTNSPATTPPAASRPAINYKLKDNPFFAANRNPEEKDAKPPLAKINKSPVTQTSKLPKPASINSTTSTSTAESRKHVRASVQRMAASSTVSANPWKAKMMKPSAIAAKKQQQHAGTTDSKPPPAAAATEKPPSSITTVKSAVRKAPAAMTTKTTTATKCEAQQQQKQQQKDDNSTKLKKSFMPTSPSPSPSKSVSSSTTASTESDKKVSLATTTAITEEEQKESITPTITTPSPANRKIPASVNKKLSINTSIEKSHKSTETPSSSLKDTPEVSPPSSTQKLHESDNNADITAPTTTKKRSITDINSSISDSDIDKVRMAIGSIVSERRSLSPTTDKSSLAHDGSIKIGTPSSTRPDTSTSEIKAVQQESEKQTEGDLTTIKNNVEEKEAAYQPATTLALLDTALDALRPTSANTDPSISSSQNLSDSDSTSSSGYDENTDEELTATTLSTNTSSNTLASSKAASTTADTTATVTSTTPNPTTAFGIVLPWYQYAHDHTPPIMEQGNGKIMMADSAEIGRQLTVSHAALAAMDFSTLPTILDAEKWQRRYSKAKSSVDSIRDRVLLETRMQRTYTSMLKLAVDRHSRPLVMDLQMRARNIDQLTQELFYTFAHVCDSQERYLHHLAGTLAITFQGYERPWESTSFASTAIAPSTAATTETAAVTATTNKKRREEYPDVVLRLEKIAKKCSFSLPSKMSQQYQQDILKLKTKSSTATRHNTDSLSDDGNLSDDSMFLASVRTSMTSFGDHQQAHALLDIIEKQLAVESTHAACDKSISTADSKNNNNSNNNADLQQELIRLRKREAEMQHRLDTQSSEFSRQRLEWEQHLIQATQQQKELSSALATQQKLEQQLAREIEERKALEETRRRLEEALRQADFHQAEIQRQLNDSQLDQAQQCQELNQALSQAKHQESRLQEEQTILKDRIQQLEQTLMSTTQQQNQKQSSLESAKLSELNQALLQANKREHELMQKVQQLEETATALHNEYASRQRNSEQSMLHKLKQERHAIQAELEISRQQESEARKRLDVLDAQVKRALSSTSSPSLDAMVTKLLEQQQQQSSARLNSSSDQQQALDNLQAAFKEAQEEYTRREAALMLQTASVEAELGAIFKEYDKLTRNITDFNHERKKYEQQVQALTREKHLLDKQLADYKVKDGIGKDGQTMTLRKEFRQLMATVKAEHEQAIEKEMEKRRQVENHMRNMKHELEMKRWDTVSTAVQTNFVAYPPQSTATM